MVEIVERRTIARQRDDVWAALAAFDDISTWAPNVDHSCLTTEQADDIGATRRVQVGRNAMLEEIVDWQPGRELAYSITGLPPVVFEREKRLTNQNGAAETLEGPNRVRGLNDNKHSRWCWLLYSFTLIV